VGKMTRAFPPAMTHPPVGKLRREKGWHVSGWKGERKDTRAPLRTALDSRHGRALFRGRLRDGFQNWARSRSRPQHFPDFPRKILQSKGFL